MFGRKRKKYAFQGKTIYTIDEYLEIEAQVPETHEFWDEKVRPLNPPDDFTKRICRAIEEFSAELADKNFKLFSNIPLKKKKVWIEGENCLFYPDLFVVENQMEYYAGREDIITNPSLIVEVSQSDSMALSRNGEVGDRTFLTDRTIKFWKYQKIPSLKEYVIISDTGNDIMVEKYDRLGDKSWNYQVFSKDGNKSVEFETNDIKLPGSLFYFGND